MRIAFVASAPFISGAERSLQTTVEALMDLGVEALMAGPESSKLARWSTERGIPFHATPLALRDKWHALKWWSSVSAMRSVLARERVDIVHSNQIWSFPTPGMAARELGLPRVCHMRDEVGPEAVRWYLKPGVEGIVCISRHI